MDGVATLDAEVNVVGLGADNPYNSTHDVYFIINFGLERCESNTFSGTTTKHNSIKIDRSTFQTPEFLKFEIASHR